MLNNSESIVNSFVIAIFIIIVTHPVYGYTITIKEKLIGILQKKTIIKNVEYFEIDAGYVHVEIKEKDQVYPYSFPCSQLVQITEDNGGNIPFNCDKSKGGISVQKGKSVVGKEKKINLAELFQENRSTKQSQFQEALIREGHSHRMELTKRNIKVEDDVVIIEVSCRRTNIQSTLIKSYWLCGYAMDKNNLFYPEIRVILNIQKKEIETLVTVANGKDVIKLGQEKLTGSSSFSKFLKILEVYRIK